MKKQITTREGEGEREGRKGWLTASVRICVKEWGVCPRVTIIKPQVWSSVTHASLLITQKERGIHASFFKPKSHFTVLCGIFNPWLLSHHNNGKRPHLGFERMGWIAFASMAKAGAWGHRGHRCLKALTLPGLRPWQPKSFSSHWVCLLAQVSNAEYTSGFERGSLSAPGIALPFTQYLTRYSALQTTSHQDLVSYSFWCFFKTYQTIFGQSQAEGIASAKALRWP